jgi:hypothetical protein
MTPTFRSSFARHRTPVSIAHSGWAVLLVAALLPGCASTGGGLFKFGDRDFPKADEKHPVTRVMALWQPSTGTGLDGLTCRGFAGQIFFFAGEDELPAEVNGDVRIYVFDDQGSREDQVKPLHEFNFPADTWKHYLAKTKLGPTYVLFIPYSRKGQHPAQCSLRLRFTAPNGAVVHSDMVNVSLPGSSGSKNAESLAKRQANRNGSDVDDSSRATEPDGDARPGTHRDPAVQLAAANIDQPATRRTARALTPAERQRIINEALARQNGASLATDGEDASPDDADDDVVYVRDDQPTTTSRRPAANRPATQDRSSVKTHTIELPRH